MARVVARHGLAAEMLADAQRDVKSSARRRAERRWLDPEVVRGEPRGRERERAAAGSRPSRPRLKSRRAAGSPPASRGRRCRPKGSRRLSSPRSPPSCAGRPPRPTTPEGSTRTFIRSSIQQSVSIISSSDDERARPATVSCTIGKVSLPGLATWRPSAIVCGIVDRDALALRERLRRVGGGLGLGSVDRDARAQVLRRRARNRRSGRRPRPGRRARRDPGPSSRSSTAAVALARHDRVVVEGRHEHRAPLAHEPGADLFAFLRVAVVEDDLGAVAARRRELRGRGVLRHDDRRVEPEQLRDERHGLRVVSGGERHDLAERAAARARP